MALHDDDLDNVILYVMHVKGKYIKSNRLTDTYNACFGACLCVFKWIDMPGNATHRHTLRPSDKVFFFAMTQGNYVEYEKEQAPRIKISDI